MHLLIFGASGHTGRQLVAQGLEKGYSITAFVRNPKSFPNANKHLVVFTGDVSNDQQILQAVSGQDAVISVLGVKASSALFQENVIISDGLKHIIHAMEVAKVHRLLFIASFGVNKKIFLPEKMFIRLVLKNIFADIPRQEKHIKQSMLDWTIVHPARLTNGPKTQKYKAKVDLPIGLFSKISRADVADFLINNIKNKNTFKKTITLSY